MRSRHDEGVHVSPCRLRIQPSSPPPNHPNNHLFRQPNSSPPPVSSSVLQPHGKTSGNQRGGAGGSGSPRHGPVFVQFAADMQDSPSGSRGWCYRELARSCQLECAVGFLVMRSLLIAPGGGEEGLIFSGFCRSLSTQLCFCFCAGGCAVAFARWRSAMEWWGGALLTTRTPVPGLPVWPSSGADLAPEPQRGC